MVPEGINTKQCCRFALKSHCQPPQQSGHDLHQQLAQMPEMSYPSKQKHAKCTCLASSQQREQHACHGMKMEQYTSASMHSIPLNHGLHAPHLKTKDKNAIHNKINKYTDSHKHPSPAVQQYTQAENLALMQCCKTGYISAFFSRAYISQTYIERNSPLRIGPTECRKSKCNSANIQTELTTIRSYRPSRSLHLVCLPYPSTCLPCQAPMEQQYSVIPSAKLVQNYAVHLYCFNQVCDQQLHQCNLSAVSRSGCLLLI
jgi:hypothetical protein